MEGNNNNMRISQTLPHFFQWLQFQRNDNKITIEWYQKIIWQFIKENGDLKIQHINLDIIWQWRKKMEEKNLAKSSQKHYLRAIIVFLKFCQEQRWHTIDIKQITLPKVPPKEVIYLENGEVKQLVEAAKDVKYRAIIEMFLSTGVRLKELVSLNRNDIQNGEIKIIGKNNKERMVFVSPRAKKWLSKYLKTRTDDNPALFLSNRNTRIAPGTIENFFWHLKRKIGFPKKLSPHICRHTLATNLVQNGADISFVKDILGHSDIGITDRFYRGINRVKLKEVHQRFLKY